MKRVFLTVLALVIVWLAYYFLIRSYEFEANFKANTLPGDVIETLRIWNRSLDSAGIVSVDSFSTVTQKVTKNNRSYVYQWNFAVVDDSITHVNVRITQPGKTFLNKITVPFGRPYIEQDAEELVHTFYQILKTHLEITKVGPVREVQLQSSFCVCSSLERNQIEKANGMMQDFSLLTSFITDFKLQPQGPPNVRVTEWYHSKGTLKYEFCFPIVKKDSLPRFENIYYKQFSGGKAIAAEYFGNYITSDRAWYVLTDYALKNDYKIIGFPVEYFLNNPNLGMNEQEWKAEIYLPVSKE